MALVVAAFLAVAERTADTGATVDGVAAAAGTTAPAARTTPVIPAIAKRLAEEGIRTAFRTVTAARVLRSGGS
ncbi:hypothetical protein Aau02nite_87550 [Amorphoplanes auranticolor]|uniref:Uncharacterized protein n=1 Tax=Actinoplanes auranticolor TaxID=47988 RepID=A0A919SW86_9ACTN|nr:hypothetical protein Aau02nite_87550 [Actinoplanes auranticolor]